MTTDTPERDPEEPIGDEAGETGDTDDEVGAPDIEQGEDDGVPEDGTEGLPDAHDGDADAE